MNAAERVSPIGDNYIEIKVADLAQDVVEAIRARMTAEGHTEVDH